MKFQTAIFRHLISHLCKTKFHLIRICLISQLLFLPFPSPSLDTHFVPTSPFIHPVKVHSPLKPRFHIGAPLFGATTKLKKVYYLVVRHFLKPQYKKYSTFWSHFQKDAPKSGAPSHIQRV